MAGYAFRTFDERKKIEDLWEAGTPAKDIATKLNISASAHYTELRRGQDGTRLPDQRRRYNADFWGVVDSEDETVASYRYCATFEDYDTEWIAYRRRLEEVMP